MAGNRAGDTFSEGIWSEAILRQATHERAERRALKCGTGSSERLTKRRNDFPAEHAH